MKMLLEIVALVVIGWVAGAEIGSWFGIQPIVHGLPYEQQIVLEQEMIQTFGVVMPILMPVSGILAVALIFFSRKDERTVLSLRVLTAICLAITVVTTLTINVPINNLTAQWTPSNDFAEWVAMRERWHFFQGVRGGLYLVAFVLLTVSSVINHR